MNQERYEQNKLLIKATQKLFKQQCGLLEEVKIPELTLMSIVFKIGLEGCIKAIKENTEWEAKTGMLAKMTNSLSNGI